MENNLNGLAFEARWTQHAILRGQQRGIKKTETQIIFDHGDRELPAGSNCYHLAVSNRKLNSLLKSGTLSPKLAEKCKKLVVLTDGKSIITTFRSSRMQ